MCATACRRCRRRWNEAVRGKENRIAIYCLFLLHLIEVGWPKQRKNNAAGGETNKKHVWEKQVFGGIFEFAEKKDCKNCVLLLDSLEANGDLGGGGFKILRARSSPPLSFA